MSAVGAGKVVHITYDIRDEQGDVLEVHDVPLAYVHGGECRLHDKIAARLQGCVVGERVEVAFEPDECFGPHDPDLCFTDDVENVPPECRRALVPSRCSKMIGANA